MSDMFGGNKGGTPDAPDFSKLAMVNQSGPMGGATWSTDPVTGQITSSSQFSGQAGDAFQGLLGGMNKAAGMDPSQAGQAASDKMYGVLRGRLDPQWQQNQGAFQARMANAGIEDTGDPDSAYGNAARTFGNQQNDAYSQASGQAIQLGQAEQAQARQNAMLPFLQAQGMMNMLPKGDPNAPFQAGAAQYGAAKDRSSANNAKKGNTLGGIAQIGGTLLGGPLAGGLLGGAAGGGGGESTGWDPMGGGFSLLK